MVASSKKYISEGKISKLNTFDKKILIFSIFIENKTPKYYSTYCCKKTNR